MSGQPEQFWRGIVPLDAVAARAIVGEVAPVPDASTFELAVDVIRVETQQCLAVLLSVLTRDAGTPKCVAWVAFSNRMQWGDRLRERGFLALDTRIECVSDGQGEYDVRVDAPLSALTEEALQGRVDLPEVPPCLRIRGVRFSARAAKGKAPPQLVTPAYTVRRFTPDAGEVTDVFVTFEDEVALLPRTGQPLPPGADITLRALDTPGEQTVACKQSWCGRLDEPLEPLLKVPRLPGKGPRAQPLPRVPRLQALKTAGFRFEEVELIGMRIDLRPYGAQATSLLREMIEPLNFHRRIAEVRPGMPFQFRPAAQAVSLELLRYGRMYWGEHQPPDGPDRFESQYELLLRVLVGRVDENSSSGREPAVYVPAILVDNAWSKVVGRELQGFKKRLARFVGTDDQPVRPAGTPGAGLSPLFDIARVYQVDELAKKAVGGVPVVDIDLPPVDPHWPQHVPRMGPYSGPTIRPLRWRQQEFTEPEFRRAFARAALEDGVMRFRSIQPAPVDGRGLPGAWITGTFTMRKLQVAFPTGVARITIHDNLNGQRSLPKAFRGLRDLLGGGPIALPSGDWYVARGAMDLRLDRGLL